MTLPRLFPQSGMKTRTAPAAIGFDNQQLQWLAFLVGQRAAQRVEHARKRQAQIQTITIIG
jgi:hypothetical protein